MAEQEPDPFTTPAGPPPPGVTPNFVNPPDLLHLVIPTIVISLVISGILVSIRLFAKIRLLRKLQYEDYILILAEACLIVWCVLLVAQPTHGEDIWNTTLATYVRFAYWSNLIIIMYVPGVLLAKWAILLQLQRVFTVQPRDKIWWIVRGLIWASSMFYLTFGFIDVFQCYPREKIWNPEVPGHCFNVNTILIGTSSFNILMNCTILVLPLVVLRDVQMQRRKKILVSCIFGVTAFAAVSSIMRLVYSIFFMHSTNPTRDIFPVALWAVAEIACVIIATTFPTMPRFFEFLRSGFDLHVGRHDSPAGSKRPSAPHQSSHNRARRSWFQLTAVGDEEQQGNESTTRIAATNPESKQSAPPSRAEDTDAGSTNKAVEVQVGSVV